MTPFVVLLFLSSVCTTQSNIGEWNGCKFQIEDESAEYFTKWVKILQGMLAHIKFIFYDKPFNATDEVLFPDRWMWTFVPPGGGKFYISWPVDYFVYSFGLLDTHSLKYPVTLYVQTDPENCSILFGGNNTIHELSNALYNMSEYYLFKLNDLYEYSYWCYITTNSKFRDSTWYMLNQYLGVPLQLFGYKCCRNFVEKRKAICDIRNENIWNIYQLLPYYIGIIVMAYFPLVVVKIGKHAIDSGEELENSGSQLLSLETKDTDFLFLKQRGPISISKLLFGLFGLGDRHPLLVSRIRRTLFVLLTPIIVYVFLLIYHGLGQGLIKEIVKHKIPCGFMSLLGGFTESRDLFLPMFGGPVISLILYNIVGMIVILVPVDLSKILELGLPPDTKPFSTLLMLDIATIEKFSKKHCLNFSRYRKVYSVMRGSIYMLINPVFLKFITLFHVRRWNSIMMALCSCCNMSRCLVLLVRVPLFIIYIFWCIFETLLMYIFYGFPIFLFILAVVRGYVRYFKQSYRRIPVVSSICAIILFPLCCLFYFFMFSIIILQSFTIIGYFIFFLYLSLIVFPSRSFGFIYFVIMFILFVHTVVKEFENEYQALLELTIKASEKLVKVKIAKELLDDKTKNNSGCCATECLALTNTIPLGLSYESLSIQYGFQNGEYVLYKEQVPGVRKDLFEYVIDKFRPVHIAFFHIIIQILCVQVLVLVSIIFISRYIKNFTSDESNEVLNVMSVVVVTMFPNLIRLLFVRMHNKTVRKRKVRQTVMDFWEKKKKFSMEN